MKASKAISVFISVVIGIYCLITVILFAAVFMGSMKTNEELLTNIWGLPKSIYLENFKKVFVDDGFFRYMLNSFLVLAGGLF